MSDLPKKMPIPLSMPLSPSQAILLPTKIQLFFGILLYFGMQVVLIPFLIGLKHAYPDNYFHTIAWRDWAPLVGLSLAAISLVIYSIFLTRRYQVGIWSLSLTEPSHPLLNLLYGACCWPLTILLIWIGVTAVHVFMPDTFASSDIDQVSVKQLKESAQNPHLFAYTLFSVLFLAPIAEEILFRGLLQRMLLRRNRLWGAILQSAFLFALMHCSTSQGWRNVEIFIALFTLACIQGYLYEMTKQLWAPLGLHITFNAATVVMLIHNSLLPLPA